MTWKLGILQNPKANSNGDLQRLSPSSSIQDRSDNMTDLEAGNPTDVQNANSNGDFESHGTADGLHQRSQEMAILYPRLSPLRRSRREPNRKNSSNQRDMTLKRIFLITNFVVELPSAVFDQLSSVRKPQYALISMILSFTVMLISIIDLARTAIAYAFLSHKAEGPIKISVWPLIFASGVLWSRFPWNTKAPVTRAVIKGPLHCWQCAKKLKRTILKNEGVQEVRVDMQKDTLTVKGTMDGKALVEFLQKKSGRRFEILPTEEEED
ncbi:hypothetical protein GH714_018402 [Hevea brasiliensis]|uniref:HMA domain-containing protein n=1 Tax=Hevea brasiliensis TaxID=3981 RepID=A0A6A6N4E4_HEVBR|nr:hypothetical protein GH714_018402 [Hevea brasiliensis]